MGGEVVYCFLKIFNFFYLWLIDVSVVPFVTQLVSYILHVFQNSHVILEDVDSRRDVNHQLVFRSVGQSFVHRLDDKKKFAHGKDSSEKKAQL